MGMMYGGQEIRRLQRDYQLIGNEKVQTLLSDLIALEIDGHANLAGEWDTARQQLKC